MALSIFVDDSLLPRPTRTTTPGAVFGERVGDRSFMKQELETLDKVDLYALQSLNLKGKPRHTSLLTYSGVLEGWVTIESTTWTKGRMLSESTGANIYQLDDIKAKKRILDVYRIGPKFRPPDPSLNDCVFTPTPRGPERR